MNVFDDPQINQIHLYINDSLYYQVSGDTLNFGISSTGLSGQQTYYYKIYDHSEESFITQEFTLDIIPFQFSVLSPSVDPFFVYDSILILLENRNNNPNPKMIQLIEKSSNKILHEGAFSNRFFIDIINLNNKEYQSSIKILDSNKDLLESEDIRFLKINGPIIQFQDTILYLDQFTDESLFIMPIKIRNSLNQNIISFDLEIEYLSELFEYKQISRTELTENALSLNVTTKENFVGIQWTALDEEYAINQSGSIFKIIFKLKQNIIIGNDTKIIFKDVEIRDINNEKISIYENHSKIYFK